MFVFHSTDTISGMPCSMEFLEFNCLGKIGNKAVKPRPCRVLLHLSGPCSTSHNLQAIVWTSQNRFHDATNKNHFTAFNHPFSAFKSNRIPYTQPHLLKLFSAIAAHPHHRPPAPHPQFSAPPTPAPHPPKRLPHHRPRVALSMAGALLTPPASQSLSQFLATPTLLLSRLLSKQG